MSLNVCLICCYSFQEKRNRIISDEARESFRKFCDEIRVPLVNERGAQKKDKDKTCGLDLPYDERITVCGDCLSLVVLYVQQRTIQSGKEDKLVELQKAVCAALKDLQDVLQEVQNQIDDLHSAVRTGDESNLDSFCERRADKENNPRAFRAKILKLNTGFGEAKTVPKDGLQIPINVKLEPSEKEQETGLNVEDDEGHFDDSLIAPEDDQCFEEADFPTPKITDTVGKGDKSETETRRSRRRSAAKSLKHENVPCASEDHLDDLLDFDCGAADGSNEDYEEDNDGIEKTTKSGSAKNSATEAIDVMVFTSSFKDKLCEKLACPLKYTYRQCRKRNTAVYYQCDYRHGLCSATICCKDGHYYRLKAGWNSDGSHAAHEPDVERTAQKIEVGIALTLSLADSSKSANEVCAEVMQQSTNGQLVTPLESLKRRILHAKRTKSRMENPTKAFTQNLHQPERSDIEDGRALDISDVDSTESYHSDESDEVKRKKRKPIKRKKKRPLKLKSHRLAKRVKTESINTGTGSNLQKLQQETTQWKDDLLGRIVMQMNSDIHDETKNEFASNSFELIDGKLKLGEVLVNILEKERCLQCRKCKKKFYQTRDAADEEIPLETLVRDHIMSSHNDNQKVRVRVPNPATIVDVVAYTTYYNRKASTRLVCPLKYTYSIKNKHCGRDYYVCDYRPEQCSATICHNGDGLYHRTPKGWNPDGSHMLHAPDVEKTNRRIEVAKAVAMYMADSTKTVDDVCSEMLRQSNGQLLNSVEKLRLRMLWAKHKKNYIPEEEKIKSFPCPHCDQVYKDKRYLTRHLKLHCDESSGANQSSGNKPPSPSNRKSEPFVKKVRTRKPKETKPAIETEAPNPQPQPGSSDAPSIVFNDPSAASNFVNKCISAIMKEVGFSVPSNDSTQIRPVSSTSSVSSDNSRLESISVPQQSLGQWQHPSPAPPGCPPLQNSSGNSNPHQQIHGWPWTTH